MPKKFLSSPSTELFDLREQLQTNIGLSFTWTQQALEAYDDNGIFWSWRYVLIDRCKYNIQDLQEHAEIWWAFFHFIQ